MRPVSTAGERRTWQRRRLRGNLALHRLKQRGIENRLMLPAMNLAAKGHLADKEAVFQQMRERTHAETAPPIVRPPASRRSLLIPRRAPPLGRAQSHGGREAS